MPSPYDNLEDDQLYQNFKNQPTGRTVPVNRNGFPTAPPPDPMQAFSQRLEASLNPKIGVRGQDTQPTEQAAFDLKNDPQNAMAYAKTVMQAVQQKMMQARQAMMARQMAVSQPSPMMAPAQPQQQMSQAIPPMGGQ